MTSSKIGRTEEIQLWEPWDSDKRPKELFTIAIPFGGGSKNDMHIRRGSRVILSDSARKFKADIGILTLAAARDVVFKKGKVYLSIFVEIPPVSEKVMQPRMDAINLLDMIADGVQSGIGINDKNFAVWRLDWAVVRFDQTIYISVGQ